MSYKIFSRARLVYPPRMDPEPYFRESNAPPYTFGQPLVVGNVSIYNLTRGSAKTDPLVAIEAVLVEYPETTSRAVVTRTVHAGSVHELPGEGGLAHFYEHLVFKRTRNFHGNTGVWFEIAAAGGRMNAETSTDFTLFYHDVPCAMIDTALDVEFDRMMLTATGDIIRDSDIESEKAVVVNEKEIGMNNEERQAMQAAWALTFPEHPYGHTTIGNAEDIRNINKKSLVAFMNKNYFERIQISVVGRIESPEHVLAKIYDLFVNKLVVPTEPDNRRTCIPPYTSPPTKTAREPIRTREPSQRGLRKSTVHVAGHNYLVVVSHAVPRTVHADNSAFNFVPPLISGSKSSRLYQTLVKTHVCDSVSTFADIRRNAGIVFTVARISAAKVAGKNAQEYLQRVEDEIAAAYDTLAAPGAENLDALLSDKTHTADDIIASTAKAQQESYRELKRSPQAYAEALGIAFANGDTLSVFMDEERSNSVGRVAIKSVGTRFFMKMNRCVVHVVPKAVAPADMASDVDTRDSARLTFKDALHKDYDELLRSIQMKEKARRNKNEAELKNNRVEDADVPGVTHARVMLPLSSSKRTRVTKTEHTFVITRDLIEEAAVIIEKDGAEVLALNAQAARSMRLGVVREKARDGVSQKGYSVVTRTYGGTPGKYAVLINNNLPDLVTNAADHKDTESIIKKGFVRTLMSYMITAGVVGKTVEEWSHELEVNLVSIDAGHYQNGIRFSLSGNTDKLDKGIDLLSQVVCNPLFPEEMFKQYKNAILSGLDQIETDVSSRASRWAKQVLNPTNSADHAIQQTDVVKRVVGAITLDELKTAYVQHASCVAWSLVISAETDETLEDIEKKVLGRVVTPWRTHTTTPLRDALFFVTKAVLDSDPLISVVLAKELHPRHQPFVPRSTAIAPLSAQCHFDKLPFYKDNAIVYVERRTPFRAFMLDRATARLNMAVALANSFSGRLCQYVRDVRGLSYTVAAGCGASQGTTPAFLDIKAHAMCNPDNAPATVTAIVKVFSWLALYGPQRAADVPLDNSAYCTLALLVYMLASDKWKAAAVFAEGEVRPAYRCKLLYPAAAVSTFIQNHVGASAQDYVEASKVALDEQQMRLTLAMIRNSRSETGMIKRKIISGAMEDIWRTTAAAESIASLESTRKTWGGTEDWKTAFPRDDGGNTEYLSLTDRYMVLVESVTEAELRETCAVVFDLHSRERADGASDTRIADTALVVSASPPSASQGSKYKSDSDYDDALTKAFSTRPTKKDIDELLDDYKEKREYVFAVPETLVVKM